MLVWMRRVRSQGRRLSRLVVCNYISEAVECLVSDWIGMSSLDGTLPLQGSFGMASYYCNGEARGWLPSLM